MQPLIKTQTSLQFESFDRRGLSGSPCFPDAAPAEAASDAACGTRQSWFRWLCERGDSAARIGFAASMGFLALTVAYGAYLDGSLSSLSGQAVVFADRVARAGGFAIDKIIIRGRTQVSEAEILDALGDTDAQSIIAFDARAAQSRLLRLGWVKTAEIQRQWPSTLLIDISERTAFAVWDSGSGMMAVDVEGRVLGPIKPEELAGLVRLRGEGAPQAAKTLADAAQPYTAIRAELQLAERVASRRWDLVFKDGLRAKLTDRRLAESLADLDRLIARRREILREAASVDLRAPGQIALQLKNPSKDNRQKLLSTITASLGGQQPRPR